MAAKHVLSVGQCGFDGPVIAGLLRDQFGADIVNADSAAEALDRLQRGHFDLALVNRQFDRGGSGLDLIARLKSDPALGHVPVMLVSNYPDAQQRAVELGALPGFGKDALDEPETTARLEAALSDQARAAS